MPEEIENKFKVKSAIVNPPTKTLYFYPVKDTYLDQSHPVDSYNGSIMRLKSSTLEVADARKIIMTFDVPVLKDAILENLVSVNLELHVSSNSSRSTELLLREHDDNDWIEDGTTWMGQPQDHVKVIQTAKVVKSKSLVKFDLKDEFKKHQEEEYKPAFTIFERDKLVSPESPLEVYSRENIKAIRPAITITYTYYPDNYDLTSIDGQVTVAHRVDEAPGGKDLWGNPTHPDLNGMIDVWGGITNADLNGTIFPKTYEGDPSIINGQLKVAITKDHLLPEGQITVRQFDEGILNSQVDINLYVASGIKPSPADPRYLHRVDPADLLSHIQTKTYEGDPLDLNGNIISRIVVGPEGHHWGPGGAYIDKDKEESLAGHIFVSPYKNTDTEYTSLLGSIFVQHVEGNWYGDEDKESTLRGKVTVRREPVPYRDFDELNGKVSVNEEPDIVEMPPTLDGIINIPSHDEIRSLNGSIIVKRNVPSKVEDAPYLNGSLNINLYNGENIFQGQMMVQHVVPNPDEPEPYLEGSLKINEYKGSSELNGQLKIKERVYLDGRIATKTYYDRAEINGHIHSMGRESSELLGHIDIRAVSDLIGKMYARPRKNKDLLGSVKVSRGTNLPYVFIM